MGVSPHRKSPENLLWGRHPLEPLGWTEKMLRVTENSVRELRMAKGYQDSEDEEGAWMARKSRRQLRASV